MISNSLKEERMAGLLEEGEEPEVSFIIAAEPDVIYDSVIEVVDIVNEAGGKKLALQLKQKPETEDTE